MADVSMNLKEFNVEFDDTNTSKSANIVSGHDIKESFAIIHKRLNNIGYTFGTEATNITSSINLNNYLTPGIYSCSNTSLTITNAPISDAFKLYVIHIVNSDSSPGDYYAQYFIPCNENCIYVRYCATFIEPAWWSDWKRLGEQVILSYGNSTWDDFYNAYIHNAVVYCRASSNNDPATGSQTRMAFMAYVNNGTDPTEVEFQYYRSVSSHSDLQQGDEVFVYKLVKNSGWSVTKREASSKIAVTSPIAKNYSNGTITLSHANSGVTAGMYNAISVDAKGHVTSGEVTNLLEFTGMSQTIYDVVITVGANDVVTASGTSTSESNSFVFGTITPLKTGHYIIKSNSTAAGQGKQYIQIRQGPGTGDTLITRVYNDPVDVELTAGVTYTCRLYFGNNIAVSDSFSIMVYPAGPADSNYVTGAPTNRRLYDTKMEYDKGRQITNGSDLDDYLTIGTYYCSSVGDSSSGAKSLLHTPFSVGGYGFAAFKLIVEKISSDTVMQQKLIPLYSNGAFFIRRRMTINGTLGWQDWQYFAHEPTYDTSPTQNSSNPVTSDGIYNAIESYSSITNNSTINIGTNTYTPIAFATCDTVADTKDKVATIAGNSTWTRKIGSIVAVKYSNTNTYDANNATSGTGYVTLNVNGTGAANIYYGATANPTGTNTAAFGYANRYIYYMWDGTYWVWLSQSTDNNTTYSGMTATEIRAGTSTSARLITPANLNLANYGLGTALKADDDLNSTSVIPVTRGNRYYGSSTQICKSIKHRPDYANSGSVIFMIETKITTSVTSGSERMIMIMYARNTTTNDTNIYYRSYGGTWGSWKQVTDSTISDYVPS